MCRFDSFSGLAIDPTVSASIAPSLLSSTAVKLEIVIAQSVVVIGIKMIHELSSPSTANVVTGPNIINGDIDSKLKALITMVQASPFCGKPYKDANAHLHNFLANFGPFQIPTHSNFEPLFD